MFPCSELRTVCAPQARTPTSWRMLPRAPTPSSPRHTSSTPLAVHRGALPPVHRHPLEGQPPNGANCPHSHQLEQSSVNVDLGCVQLMSVSQLDSVCPADWMAHSSLAVGGCEGFARWLGCLANCRRHAMDRTLATNLGSCALRPLEAASGGVIHDRTAVTSGTWCCSSCKRVPAQSIGVWLRAQCPRDHLSADWTVHCVQVCVHDRARQHELHIQVWSVRKQAQVHGAKTAIIPCRHL